MKKYLIGLLLGLSLLAGTVYAATYDNYLFKPGFLGGQIVYGGTTSTDNLTIYSNTSKDGYINLGDGARIYEPYGQLQVGIDGVKSGLNDDPNVPINVIADSNGYYAANIGNVSTGTMAEAGWLAYNRTAGTYNYLAMLGENSTKYPTYNPGAAILEASSANLYINALGNSSSTGNVIFASGGNNSTTTRKMIITYDGKMGIGTMNPVAPLDVKGMARFDDGIGIGTNPDINYNFKVRSNHTVGLDLQAGDGYNLLYLERALGFSTTTPIGYYGLGSLTDNDIQFGGYDVGADSAGFRWYVKSVDTMHVSSTGNFYYGYNNSADLFSIGEADNSALTARLQVKESRSNASDRTILQIDSGSAMSVKSRLLEVKSAGVEKMYVDGNGVIGNIDAPSVATTDGTTTTIATLPIATNKRTQYAVNITAKQSGNTPGGYWTLKVNSARYTTGDVFLEGIPTFSNSQYDPTWGGVTVSTTPTSTLIQAQAKNGVSVSWKAEVLLNTN